MPIRLLCDARGGYRKRFLDRLLELAGPDVQLGLHMGDIDADFEAPCIPRMEVRKGTRGHIMDNDEQSGANLSLIASPAFQRQLESAIDQLQRSSSTYRYRSHNLKNIQDYIDYYHILSDVFARKIIDEGITHALFFDVPHLAYDSIMYDVARQLGVKTVILSQFFPGTFFSTPRIEDFGCFDPSDMTAAPFLIEKGVETELFYMNSAWQKESARGRITARAVASFLTYVVRRQPLKLLDPVYISKTLRRIDRIYKGLPDWRDPFAKFFHTNELAYFEHLAEYEKTEFDLSKPYIYVPLHLQPEMTTSSLGGRYRDQVLMIETLARDLPEGWEIYVKENPKQGAFARGPMFFHRLSRIPSVRFLPSSANTAALTENARLVATVTGTAGWEAIRKGRPAVVFGAAWYQSLPGIHKYREGIDLATIADTPIDHGALEKAAGALFARSHEGMIDKGYFALAEYDAEANAQKVAQAALGLLKGDIAFSFGETGADPRS